MLGDARLAVEFADEMLGVYFCPHRWPNLMFHLWQVLIIGKLKY